MKNKYGVPSRWRQYSKMGDIVEGTRLLPIKVPLQGTFEKRLGNEGQKFNIGNMVTMAKERDINIGLVVDLTNTMKYYKKEDLHGFGIEYKKVFVPGQMIPVPKICEQFIQTVSAFEESNKDNNKVIAVHCTHGLNRTGYIVCKYLIEEKKIEPGVAIERFNHARGHKIERQNYLNDLLGVKKRFPRNEPCLLVNDHKIDHIDEIKQPQPTKIVQCKTNKKKNSKKAKLQSQKTEKGKDETSQFNYNNHNRHKIFLNCKPNSHIFFDD